MGIKSDIGLLVQKKMSHMDKDYIPAPSMLCAGIEMGNRIGREMEDHKKQFEGY